MKERNHLKDLGINVTIILKRLLSEQKGKDWVHLSRETGGVLLQTQKRNFRFHKTQEISSLTKKLLASYQGRCSECWLDSESGLQILKYITQVYERSTNSTQHLYHNLINH
jgi:hypothetical protein